MKQRGDGVPEDTGSAPTGYWVQPEDAEIDSDALDFAPTFYEIAALPGFAPAPGIVMNVMAGGRMMANWVRIEPEASVPTHAHPHEQIGLVLEGEIHMTIANETRILVPGHAYTIPGNLPHAAVAGAQGCLVLDIFSPIRQEYLDAVTRGE
ncbi:MAG TPA: cupin domain-containing protein [Thermomicrobiales bacterium]|nr:cupin domain-containing protein [Thermomicrobiales bacterium]